ncbi:hypothetical protein B5C34_03815 [Pacificimonas flava]|uniref:Polysaccharide pyruvyl transferase domain-containing protein n=2 Tax=Pacificimonas TaxID=1960290 RepID=A0A219B2X3_9SPHN|nr:MULTISPECIES: polysaccharide pyruvyl transferase family protein [Pacificimonas]MBZ6377656.1 polysaccharide pyruvyl transferase family protein [Pacificimonas aurantium]OWV32661.1 hypothetical protein B5C34_03815 [Pacificimonas flava]
MKRLALRAALAPLRISHPPDGRGAAAIFAPASGGSLGDQAMVDATARRIAARGLEPIVVQQENWDPIPVRSNVLRLVSDGFGAGFAAFAYRLASRCRHAIFIGADVADGVYGPGTPRWFLRMTDALTAAGVDCRLGPFSVSETPNEQVLRDFAARAALKIYARDPVSARRFEKHTGRRPDLATDLAFGLVPELTACCVPAADWIAARGAAGGRAIGVNISTHVTRQGPGKVEAVADGLAAWLRDHKEDGLLLMHHDVRGEGGGDLALSRDLAARLAPEFGQRIDRLPETASAWDVKALAGDLDFVFTGRMHLAIAALGRATPVAALVYQGKFEGLFQNFGLDAAKFCTDLPSMTAERVTSLFAEMAARADDVRSHVEARLPEVEALSLLPVREIGTAPA